jgi:VWFA-related protein
MKPMGAKERRLTMGAQANSDMRNDRYLRREFVLSAISLVGARAQQAPTFSSEVKVVNVLATVRDKKGRLIGDLTKDDFSLTENGRPQTIRYFARESDLPLTLGLMVDTSMSQQRVLNAERGASFRFLDRVLREEKDQVFIMQFDLALRMRQELTSSRKQLDEALTFVDTPTFNELRNQYGGGTLLFDAIVAATKDVMQRRTNRKALIVLSDGGENGSDATLEGAVDAAQRADTLIYSILFADAAYGMPLLGRLGGLDGKAILQRLSKETGGGFLEVSKKQGIDQIFDVIQEELRSQYSLGYVSDQPVRISEFRTIRLTTRQPGLVVRARDRYWAKR